MTSLGFANPAVLTNCTIETCDYRTSFYNYRVNLGANIAFLVCFSLLLIAYVSISFIFRRCHTYNFTMTLGLCTEIAGYAGRICSHYNQWEQTPYFLQLCCITIAPASFAAGIYLCLGWIVLVHGRENSRVNPAIYPLAFMPCDTISLVIQLAGGIVAAAALSEGDLNGIAHGVDLFTAGLAWQVFTLFAFLCVGIDLALLIRRRRHKVGDAAALDQDPRHVAARKGRLMQYFPYALALATILIFWRCIFRLVELNDGFNGPVTFDQGLYIGFEGVIIVAAITVMAVFHPAVVLGEGVTMELPR